LRFIGKDLGSLSVRTAYADCLRSQTAHFEAATDIVQMAFRARDAHISVKIATIQDCGPAMRPWRQVVEEILSPSVHNEPYIYLTQDAIAAIESIVSTDARLLSRLDGNMPDSKFRGALHCGACLAEVVNPSISSEYSVSAFLWNIQHLTW
jgi:hypothetical protein